MNRDSLDRHSTWNGEERRVDVDARVLEQIMRTTEEHAIKLDEKHADHHRFINELIEREHKRNKFRDAVIEKTLSSLAWSILVGLALALWMSFKANLK